MLLSHMIANEVGHRNICSAIGVSHFGKCRLFALIYSILHYLKFKVLNPLAVINSKYQLNDVI